MHSPRDLDFDALLRRVQDDLRALPRHEWDGYLWQLCSRIAQAPRGAVPLDSPHQRGTETPSA